MPTGATPVLKFDARVFENKVGQEANNQYDGGKGGEAWRVFIGGSQLSQVPMMGHVPKWCEDHGNVSISMEGIGNLVGHLD